MVICGPRALIHFSMLILLPLIIQLLMHRIIVIGGMALRSGARGRLKIVIVKRDVYVYNGNMSLIHGVGDFFALDIGTTAIRLIQLAGDAQHGWVLQKFAYVPMDRKTLEDSSAAGRRHLGEIILGAMQQAGITTKNVAVGMPAGKTFTTVIKVENQAEKDVLNGVKYQLDKYIPMAIDDATVDFVSLGVCPIDATKVEVLISSTAADFAEERMEMIESFDLNVVAQEPESIAMARALMPVGATDARLIIDLGEHSTDLVMMYKGAPRLVRSVPGGFSVFVKTVSSSLNVKEEQARQFILKFGLAQDKVEGQVFRALDSTLESFTSELNKSISFFRSEYMNTPVGGTVLSGFAGMIPFIAEYIEAKTNVTTTQGNPWQLVKVSPEQQRVLQPVASEFAVAIGLAERSND